MNSFYLPGMVKTKADDLGDVLGLMPDTKGPSTDTYCIINYEGGLSSFSPPAQGDSFLEPIQWDLHPAFV